MSSKSKGVPLNGVTGRIIRGRAVYKRLPNCAISRHPTPEELMKGKPKPYIPSRD